MSHSGSLPTLKFSPDELLQHFTSVGYDPAEMESFFIDLVHHYLYPTENWELSPERTKDVLDKSTVFMDLLRGIRTAQPGPNQNIQPG
ncbi:hypothetical protein [Dyadobacter sp. CY323]|uniref:hypothetical protein n=1 Tax=Dyadobacter sp. CY323 TaxID=2907302 RepID=UPI001F23E95C|nr:hypothetical protein [Dyadobacter sp. CY323]MCE6992480.1 hypothetical protein [Dyadobacter sp. CY323]